jgi:hypothetical protein
MRKGKLNLGALALGLAILALLLAAIVLLSQQGRVIDHTADFTFTIVEIPDYAVTITNPADPPPIAYPGQVFPVGILITPNSSYAGDVRLTVENLPTGVTAAWFPAATITVGGAPASVNLNLTLPLTNDLQGPHTIRVRAISSVYNGNQKP